MAEEKAAAPKSPAPAEKKKEGKTKRPSALKRDLQNQKRRLRNRSFQASVLTAVRSLESSLNQKESPDAVKQKLNKIYSLMDKGVKKGIYKPQKAARTKSRLSTRCAI